MLLHLNHMYLEFGRLIVLSFYLFDRNSKREFGACTNICSISVNKYLEGCIKDYLGRRVKEWGGKAGFTRSAAIFECIFHFCFFLTLLLVVFSI